MSCGACGALECTCEIGRVWREQERPYGAVAVRPGAEREAERETLQKNLDKSGKPGRATHACKVPSPDIRTDTDKANYRRGTITVRYYEVHCTRVQWRAIYIELYFRSCLDVTVSTLPCSSIHLMHSTHEQVHNIVQYARSIYLTNITYMRDSVYRIRLARIHK